MRNISKVTQKDLMKEQIGLIELFPTGRAFQEKTAAKYRVQKVLGNKTPSGFIYIQLLLNIDSKR